MTTTSHSFIIGPRCGSDPGDYPQANYIFHAIARSVGFLVFVIICAVVAIVSAGERPSFRRRLQRSAPIAARGRSGEKSTLARPDDLKKWRAERLRSVGSVARMVAGSSHFAFPIATSPATAALIFRHPRHCRLSRRLKNSAPVAKMPKAKTPKISRLLESEALAQIDSAGV